MAEIDKHGFLKVDVLGSKNQQTLRICEDKTGIQREDISFTDKKVIKQFALGNTTSIAQFSSAQMIELLRIVQPETFEDLIACTALVRPGANSYIRDFASRTKSAPVPQAEHILAPTRGVLLYQEQAMQIAREIAGFSLVEADNLRRVIGKKKREDMMKIRPLFVAGCMKNGVDEAGAEALFANIAEASAYSFNKSHAAAYTLVSYWEMWYRVHHPAAFFTAEFSSNSDDTDRVRRSLREAARHGVKVVSPCINASDNKFSIDNNEIRFGFAGIKNLGEKAVQAILSAREENGPFKSLEDFRKRIAKRECNARAMESLISAGAFDSLGIRREDAMRFIAHERAKTKKEKTAVAESLLEPWTFPQWAKAEFASLGYYLTANPIDLFTERIQTIGAVKASEALKQNGMFSIIAAIDAVTVKKVHGHPMGVVMLGDETGCVELVLWSEEWAREGDKLSAGDVIEVSTSLDSKGRLALSSRRGYRLAQLQF